MVNSKDLKGFITVPRIYKLLPAIYFIILYRYQAHIFTFIEGYSLNLVEGILIYSY